MLSFVKGIFVTGIAIIVSCGNALQKRAGIADNLRIKTGKGPGCVEVADFNNDKIPDLAVTNEQDNSVTILLGNGKDQFNEAKSSPFSAGYGVNDIAIGDFNKDGRLDFAFANHEKKYLTVLLGNGDGSFLPASHSPFPVEVLPHTHGVATGDFNEDKLPDLVTDSWQTNQVEILFGDSENIFKTPGTFFKVGKHPYQRVRVADINMDGNDDIITTNLEGDNVSILLCDGKGNFKEAEGSPFPCGNSPFGVAIGNVNADSKPDLAIINSPASTSDRTGINGLTILLGDGTGKFKTIAGSPFPAGKIPNHVAIGDVNGDGVADIAVSDNDSNTITLFLMSKKGNISTSSMIMVGNHPKGVAIADLNGDGKCEIVVCNNLDNDITIITGK